MKKSILFSALFLLSIGSFAQSVDTSKVEQYCEIVAIGKLFSRKVSITVDFGQSSSFWKDQRLKNDQGEIEKFNSVVDALNYFGKNGWKLVNAFPMSEGSGSVYHFYFKKSFGLADVNLQ